jgi:DNA invertase Pin-like site-specific DNA recombinase
LQSFKNIRVDDFFCNFLDKRFCFFFLKLEQIFIFQRSLYKIDRIARSLKGLIEIIELLSNKSVELVSLDSGDKVDTTSPMGRAFFQIAGVFAELERSMINARTKAGIAKAKLNGVKFGRIAGSSNKTTLGKIEKIKIFLQAGKTYSWISKELSVSKKTISDIKKLLQKNDRAFKT